MDLQFSLEFRVMCRGVLVWPIKQEYKAILFSLWNVCQNMFLLLFSPVSSLYFLDCCRRTICGSQHCSLFPLRLWSAVLGFKELYSNLCPVLHYVNWIWTSVLLTLLFQRAERFHRVCWTKNHGWALQEHLTIN